MSSARAMWKVDAGVAIRPSWTSLGTSFLTCPAAISIAGTTTTRDAPRADQVVDRLADRRPGELQEPGRLEPIGPEPPPGVGQGPELLDPRLVPAPVGGDQQGVGHRDSAPNGRVFRIDPTRRLARTPARWSSGPTTRYTNSAKMV